MFQRGTGRFRDQCRVRPEVQRLVTFRQLNLTTTPWPMHGAFDAIFCRNVLIYFDEVTQRKLVRNLHDKLKLRGYLFLGHSEHYGWLAEHFESQGHTDVSCQAHASEAASGRDDVRYR